MDNKLSTQSNAAMIENVVVGGDLSKLSPEQRVSYYMQVCASIGLNPLTKPFDYISLNGRLVLYARKDAADQLRKINGISIEKPDITFQDDWIIVTVVAVNANGRKDSDVGVVNKKDMRGDFGNALMKAVTKAKRRVTLSICGLGMLDETEIETMPAAKPVAVAETGEIIEGHVMPAPAPVVFDDSLPAMELEAAMAVTNRDNATYGSLTTDKLAYMANAMRKHIRENDLIDEELETLKYKLSAAQTILAARQPQS